MKRRKIVERIAEERAVPLHKAADLYDSVLCHWIQQIKDGRSVELPAPKAPAQRKKLAGPDPGGRTKGHG